MSEQPTRPPASRDRKQRNTRRHQARVLAMQILYEADLTGHSTSEILVRTRNQEATPDETLEYTSFLLTGVRARERDITVEIEMSAPDYPISGIAPIDRSILQIGVFEALYADDVPLRAAINEAVEIAREYGGDASARFINGVLGSISERAAPQNDRSRPN